MDSLILCKFLRGVFRDFHAEAAEMLVAVTGWPVTALELKTLARRVVNARKCLNEREGWTRLEDALPARLLEASASPPGSPSLSRERLDTMIAAYYRERGWDHDGRVPMHLRRELGLDDPSFGTDLPPSRAAREPDRQGAGSRLNLRSNLPAGESVLAGRGSRSWFPVDEVQ